MKFDFYNKIQHKGQREFEIERGVKWRSL